MTHADSGFIVTHADNGFIMIYDACGQWVHQDGKFCLVSHL